MIPKHALAAAVVFTFTFAFGTGCLVQTTPPKDPCDPNPCKDAHKSRCVAESGKAQCLCDDGFLTRPNGTCEEVSAANCPSHAGDAAEPDDCMSKAKAVTFPFGPETRSVDPVGDYDFASFSASANHVYRARAQVKAGALSPRLDLFDQTGLLLSTAEGGGDVVLEAKVYTSGGHFVRVMHSPLDPSVATGDYALSLSDLGVEDHGDGPNDATAMTADVAGSGTPTDYSGRFEFPQDQDWFSFSASSGTAYRIAFDPGRTIPTVSLWDSATADAPKWTVQQPVIDFDLPASGTVYLALYPPDGKSGGTYAFNFLR